jgi:hypothetical protein
MKSQKRHSYLIMFLVVPKQRFWAKREGSPQCKKQRLRRCLDLIILVVRPQGTKAAKEML